MYVGVNGPGFAEWLYDPVYERYYLLIGPLAIGFTQEAFDDMWRKLVEFRTDNAPLMPDEAVKLVEFILQGEGRKGDA